MAFNNKVIHGKHYPEDKIKFTGKNTQTNIIWMCSGNTYREIYDWLVDHEVITRYDYDPVEEYILDALGKTYEDYKDDETDEIDFDKILKDGEIILTDDSYYEIISHENGNAYYQEWELEDKESKKKINRYDGNIQFAHDGTCAYMADHCITLRELKEIINSIDEKYDNEKIVVDDPDYNEYCLGDGMLYITGIEIYQIDSNYSKGQYISFTKKH